MALSQWRKYILWFAQEHVEFRKSEIDSILKLRNICMRNVVNVGQNDPFWIVELENDEAAKRLASRSVSLRCVMEHYSHSTNYGTFHTGLEKYVSENYSTLANLFGEDKTFKITVETYNKHLTQSDKVRKIEEFDYMPIKGSVDLKNPDTDWWYIEYYGTDPLHVPAEPECTLFGKWIADGQRSVIKDLSLKKRKFIGNTSMDPQLSLLMANQALVQEGDFVLDPFVGTGSLLVAAAKFGGFVMGTDIDYMMLHGKTKPSRISQKIREKDECVESNFVQYQCESQYLDVIITDFSLPTWRANVQFDCIITDPPYGIREATEKVESKSRKKPNPNSADPNQPHYPSTSNYNLDEMFYDLLVFSVQHLKLGGRLVCWIPFYRADYTPERIPKHPCLEIIANSEQVLSNFTSRRLLTYEKIVEPAEDDLNSVVERSSNIDFRDRYFCPMEESRQERRIRVAKLKETGRQEALKRGKVLNEEGKVVYPKSPSETVK